MFIFALFGAIFAAPNLDRIASRSSATPYAHQAVGYQFYARAALPVSLEEELRASYKETVVGESRTAGQRYDVLRQEATAHCAALERDVHDQVPDKCTRVAYSPFLMVCEVTIVVTRECMSRRNVADAERFDGEFANLLSSHRTQLGVKK
jgi:hypothetical protein